VFAEFHATISEKDSKMAGLQQELRELKLENARLRQSAGTAPAEKEKKSLLVPTTPQERRNLELTLSGDENDVIMDLQLANASARIIVMNLTCVRSGEWLNSETINVYLQMVEVASKLSGENVTSFNSFFVSKLEKEVCSAVVGYLFQTSHLTPHTSHLTSHLTPHTSLTSQSIHPTFHTCSRGTRA
jgi:Ulp1 family protease